MVFVFHGRHKLMKLQILLEAITLVHGLHNDITISIVGNKKWDVKYVAVSVSENMI